jgi:catechol 2,3-dioxygenase-like lactoylglutathione lyase family enzyme
MARRKSSGSDQPLTHGLTHIAIGVKDPARSFAFYQKVVGIVKVWDDGNFLQAQTPGARDVVVFERATRNVGRSAGIAHFGFRLTSPDRIDETVRRIEAAGGTITERGEFVPGEPYLFARDLDGYLFEIWYEIPTAVDP